jgi:hypothetical protein
MDLMQEPLSGRARDEIDTSGAVVGPSVLHGDRCARHGRGRARLTHHARVSNVIERPPACPASKLLYPPSWARNAGSAIAHASVYRRAAASRYKDSTAETGAVGDEAPVAAAVGPAAGVLEAPTAEVLGAPVAGVLGVADADEVVVALAGRADFDMDAERAVEVCDPAPRPRPPTAEIDRQAHAGVCARRRPEAALLARP